MPIPTQKGYQNRKNTSGVPANKATTSASRADFNVGAIQSVKQPKAADMNFARMPQSYATRQNAKAHHQTKA